jgi:hypothetical protein
MVHPVRKRKHRPSKQDDRATARVTLPPSFGYAVLGPNRAGRLLPLANQAFLIKPVQQICKYNVSQLSLAPSSPSDPLHQQLLKKLSPL